MCSTCRAGALQACSCPGPSSTPPPALISDRLASSPQVQVFRKDIGTTAQRHCLGAIVRAANQSAYVLCRVSTSQMLRLSRNRTRSVDESTWLVWQTCRTYLGIRTTRRRKVLLHHSDLAQGASQSSLVFLGQRQPAYRYLPNRLQRGSKKPKPTMRGPQSALPYRYSCVDRKELRPSTQDRKKNIKSSNIRSSRSQPETLLDVQAIKIGTQGRCIDSDISSLLDPR